MLQDIKLKIQVLPESPGVYQYYDKDGTIIYVGKAINLKRRVASYFNKQHDDAKTRVLVSKICNINHIVVATETDALLLENNLIKKYKPKYNVLLKDDKTYPWICIKKERFPRIFVTRKMIKDGSEYFGPYTHVKTAYALLDLIKELYPIRTCAFDLSNVNIQSHKYKVCLDYHIKKCLGPCEGLQSEQHYKEQIVAVKNIIKGNFKQSLLAFEKIMMQLASQLEFEEAQKIKEKIDLLANYQAKSTVVNPTINNVDVFTILSDVNYAYVNFFKISNGAIIQSHTTEIKKKLNESDKDLLELAIVELRERFHSLSREILVPFEVVVPAGIKVTVPLQGEKLRLIELSLRNAKYFQLEKFKQIQIIDPERHTKRIMAQMQKDLHLSEAPIHIECFDNSNIQGTNPVSACVVFKNGKPSKKDYRHFNINSVEGPNDFASMEEVVYRRYKRLLEENEPLPQLIIIDGGKGQLSAALKSLEVLGLRGKIAIIGIAKRLEELFFPDDPIPLYLDKNSETLKIIQQLRNEAHRFGITHHRNRRSNSALNTTLEEIPGIGPQSITALLQYFKSVKRVKTASFEDLVKVVGNAKAIKIQSFFNSSN